ncbi:hypothetical protein EXE59_11110 [Nocardioides eburneiflavus]|uniref:Uncharacterized protein n=1 Tax=Nocardioides eburneiflavus TaxID=2518372 RepID=A0A4Z1CMF1_9ACTN|nr:hypothetical protein [Nocardioides eburneiflavus]TGN64449.1 hypothetical protein EXE59_11110 [Nocardioides eburneiflavus]
MPVSPQEINELRPRRVNALRSLPTVGAGTKADESCFVRCDLSTMTQADIDAGRLVLVVGVAPVEPAEFVVFRIAVRTNDLTA